MEQTEIGDIFRVVELDEKQNESNEGNFIIDLFIYIFLIRSSLAWTILVVILILAIV